MSDTFFSAEVMNRTIDMVTKGLRDLRSPLLRPFYTQPDPIPRDYPTSAYDDMADEMLAGELTPPTQPEFATQLASTGGAQLFLNFMQESGILLVDDRRDIVEEESGESLPNLGHVSDFLTALSESGDVEIDVGRAREIADLLNIPAPPSTLLHLSLKSPSAYAETDPVVARRMRRMREYVRAYFEG